MVPDESHSCGIPVIEIIRAIGADLIGIPIGICIGAKKREYYLKSLKSRKAIEKLIATMNGAIV